MEYRCPITNEICQDPVVAIDGYVYEREAILNWFSHTKISPKTGEHITDVLMSHNPNVKIPELISKENSSASERRAAAIKAETQSRRERIEQLKVLNSIEPKAAVQPRKIIRIIPEMEMRRCMLDFWPEYETREFFFYEKSEADIGGVLDIIEFDAGVGLGD